ncbi:hypothetical protein [Paenibacillus rhizophilus]|uniref:hypothetical protein n=1 Tax=Paenibacillus rhizophilus TaxID=1850366 RepID=UPI001639C28B|nr:hypothetical protein [Paenibacillus rhizophilus]
MNNPTYPNQCQCKAAYPMGGDVKLLSQRYMSYHVIAHTKDGAQFDGIIEGMDENGVTMLVPEEVDGEERENDNTNRQLGYGQRRFRRFRRRQFPFFYFAFPFFAPYPYYYPYSPYSPYSPGYGYGGGY